LLGDTGSEYVLVANPDEGTNERQIVLSDGGGSVGRLVRHVRACRNKGWYVTEIDLHAATRAWYVAGKRRDGSGRHSWLGSSNAGDAVRRPIKTGTKVSLGSRMDAHGNVEAMYVILNGQISIQIRNIPDELKDWILQGKLNRSTNHCVRLFHRGGYFTSASAGASWGGLPPGVVNELAKPGCVRDVAIATNGSWVVLRDDSFAASPGVAAGLVEKLNLFYTRQTARKERRVQEIQEYHAAAEEACEIERLRLRTEAELAANEVIERVRRVAALADALRPSCAEIRRSQAELENRKAGYTRLVESVQSQLEPLSPRSRALAEDILDLDELIDSSPFPARATQGERSGSDLGACVICTDRPAIRALIPCGHLCLCDECSVQFLRSASQRACPLCRVQTTSTLRIYRQD
jgi:Zinc finger, C3HC4 type (RING finger)